jgi:hypothetical protein
MATIATTCAYFSTSVASVSPNPSPTLFHVSSILVDYPPSPKHLNFASVLDLGCPEASPSIPKFKTSLTSFFIEGVLNGMDELEGGEGYEGDEDNESTRERADRGCESPGGYHALAAHIGSESDSYVRFHPFP